MKYFSIFVKSHLVNEWCVFKFDRFSCIRFSSGDSGWRLSLFHWDTFRSLISISTCRAYICRIPYVESLLWRNTVRWIKQSKSI